MTGQLESVINPQRDAFQECMTGRQRDREDSGR